MYNVGTLHTILPPSMYPQPYTYNMGTHTFFHLISILNFPLKTCEVHIVNTTRSVVTVKIYDLSDTTFISITITILTAAHMCILLDSVDNIHEADTSGVQKYKYVQHVRFRALYCRLN